MLRRLLLVIPMFAATPLGCGTEDESSVALRDPNRVDATSSDGSDNLIVQDGSLSTTLAVEPSTASLDVTVTDGAATLPSVTLRAVDAVTRKPVTNVTWDLDRAELASVSVTGVVTARGKYAGTAKVTARSGGSSASADVTLRVTVTANGAHVGSGTGPQSGPTPIGGFNGVGGQVLGPGVAPAIRALLDGPANQVPAAQFEWLYPYDNTVFPRGILAPLLQWRTAAAGGGAFGVVGMKVHLVQAGYEFTGYYAAPAGATEITSAPIDADVWKTMTSSNGGDPLEVEVRVTNGTAAYGPLKRKFKIAPGLLRGTVFYNSYGTRMAKETQGQKGGTVLRIRPGDIQPTLAVPGSDAGGKCVVCHTVSAKGNRLFSNDTDQGDYGYARSYDITSSSTSVFRSYGPGFNGQPNADVIGKLSYAGPYPDGSFFLASSGENYHAWSKPSNLFRADNYEAIASTGFTNTVARAVTPAFSLDGKRVAFNFWEGVGSQPLAGSGRTLVAMDFDCHANANGQCGAPPYVFSGLRLLVRETSAAVGWPAFTPDGKWVIYQRSTNGGDGSVLNTSPPGRADLGIVSADPGATTPTRLCALMGLSADCNTSASPSSYLPTGPNHPAFLVDDANPGDTNLNFEPTITPVASGGYFWVLFTSRRLYGNVATLEPYAGRDDGNAMPGTPVPKKLWVSAIDLHPSPGVDPSHPPFYLPGQELLAGNMRGFWVNDPCRDNGATCETGDECCNGFCRQGATGLVCQDKPPNTCAQEFESCTQSVDCCAGSGFECIGGRCARNIR